MAKKNRGGDLTTKEQEKAIERCNELIKESHSCWIGLSNQKAIQEVLNMLKEKDREINRKSSTINALQCALHGRTEERDRKDNIITRQNKQIDLMAEYINEIDVSEEICEGKTMCDENCKECIKQYFESKAEKE